MTEPGESGGWRRDLLKDIASALGKLVLGVFGGLVIIGVVLIVVVGVCLFVTSR